MLTRDTLEELEIVYLPEDGSMHDTEDGEHLASLGPRRRAGIGPLFAASPKLALACLEALTLARRVAEHFQDTDAPLGELARQRVEALGAVLAAAGVEVE